jgi:uncharacterized protein YjbI with pentapeptide repeats
MSRGRGHDEISYRHHPIRDPIGFHNWWVELPMAARKAYRWEHDLMGAQLHGLDLRSVDLSRRNLEGADLAGADLSGADLRGGNLTNADLKGAVLCDTNCTDTNFVGADLRDANMRAALTRGADFAWSQVQGLNLAGTGASAEMFQGAQGDPVNLYECEIHVAHRGPQTSYDSLAFVSYLQRELGFTLMFAQESLQKLRTTGASFRCDGAKQDQTVKTMEGIGLRVHSNIAPERQYERFTIAQCPKTPSQAEGVLGLRELLNWDRDYHDLPSGELLVLANEMYKDITSGSQRELNLITAYRDHYQGLLADYS